MKNHNPLFLEWGSLAVTFDLAKIWQTCTVNQALIARSPFKEIKKIDIDFDNWYQNISNCCTTQSPCIMTCLLMSDWFMVGETG